jgi:predicted transcriptional regulator
MKKNPTSFRLSDEALRLLAKVAENLGIAQSGALELAIRDLADKRNIQ